MGMGDWTKGPIIGRGSTATVSLATSIPSGELFAVKSADLSRSADLQREQRILSSLNSPFLISYLGFDIAACDPESRRLHYNLFLEYAPGGSLSDQIKNSGGGGLDEAAVRSHAREIFAGLAYLHSKNITHCDIKGQNVLIGSDGRAKIADLGCARSPNDGGDAGKAQLRGTPMFMAPEVARGEEQGFPADIWAAGCTVIEMATGALPWPDVSDPVAVLHRIAFSDDVPKFPTWLSEEGRDFLDKCLRRDHKDRWTVDQLLAHPFLMNSVPTSCSERNWSSPKSILDHSFWKSLTNEVEEVDSEITEIEIGDRFEGLVGDNHVAAVNWTWDEDWITVRTSSAIDGDESAVATISTDDHNSIISTATTSDDSELESVVCANHMGFPCDNYDFVSSDDWEKGGAVISWCDGNFVTMFWISKWIFALVPVGTLLLSFPFWCVVCCAFTFGLVDGMIRSDTAVNIF